MEATPGARINYLIRRRTDATRDELVMHWFKNHMPLVIERQIKQAEAGRLHAWQYVATVFDPQRAPEGERSWDGVASLYFDESLPAPRQPAGTNPTDTFQQKAEPYMPWPTTEYILVDGDLPVEPLTLNEPFPTTRSGFIKFVSLVAATAGADFDAMFQHWLGRHGENVATTMQTVGGYRYVLSLSNDPATAPYAGMAELYFPDMASCQKFFGTLQPDGIEQWIDPARSRSAIAVTEMVGIEAPRP